MLDSFRSSKSNVFFWIIIGLLIIGLAGFGIGSSGGGSGTSEVARVGDHQITVDEYAQALNVEQRRFVSGYGRSPSEAELDALGRQVMEQLLSGAALDGQAEALGISVSDDTVREELMATSAFLDASGNFDRATYEFALENAGLTAGEYDEIVRSTAARRLMEAGVGGGVMFPTTAAEALVAYYAEERGVSWVRLADDALTEPVPEPADTDLETHHAQNAALYTLPERRMLAYAYANEDSLVDDVDVAASDIQALYEERAEVFSRPERRIVDRIVFGDAADAEAALARIQDGSAGFDDIAAERSLSAADIDQGDVAREDLNAEEAELLFATQDLGVFGPVASDLGPALYRVNASLEATQTDLAEVEDQLRDEIAREQADALIAQELTAIEDLLAGGATLEELAQDTLLEFGTMEFSENSQDGIAADAAFRDEARAADVGEFRELADLSDGVFVLRVDEIKPPELQPLDDVRATVADDWRDAQVQAALEALAETIVAEIEEGKTLGAVAADRDLIVSEETPLNRRGIIAGTTPEFVASLFDTDGGRAFSVADDQGVLIGVVGEIVAADVTSEDLTQAVEIATSEFRAGATDDALTLFSRAIQDSTGVEANRVLMQQINQQFASGL